MSRQANNGNTLPHRDHHRGWRPWHAFLLFFLLPCLLLSLCTACSSQGTHVLNLDSARPLAASSPYTLHTFRGDPKLYEVQGPHLPFSLFLSATEECGLADRSVLARGPRSASRQLFVGIQDFSIVATKELQESEAQNTGYWWWLVEGSLEGEKLVMAHYSFLIDDCVADFVYWSAVPPKKNIHEQRQERQLRKDFFLAEQDHLRTLASSSWKKT